VDQTGTRNRPHHDTVVDEQAVQAVPTNKEKTMTMSTAVTRTEQTAGRLPYDHRQEDPESQRAHTWINFTPAAPLSDSQLAALRTEAQRLGRPLTDAESKIILGPLEGSTATRVVCGPDDNGVITAESLLSPA
jgi:hypothetical protein